MRQKIRIFAAVAGCMALLATGAQAAYSDIPESHWAYDVVNQSADLGVIRAGAMALLAWGSRSRAPSLRPCSTG